MEQVCLFFINHIQCVKYHNSISTLKCIIYSDPNGSILFILSMNAIVNSSKWLQYTLYALDSALYVSDNNVTDIVNSLNSELDILDKCFLANKLTLNVKEKFSIFFQRYFSYINRPFPDVIITNRNIHKTLKLNFWDETLI